MFMEAKHPSIIHNNISSSFSTPPYYLFMQSPSVCLCRAEMISPVIENRLRLMVREETEHAVSRFFHTSTSTSTSTSTTRHLPSARFQLRFVGQPPSPIFTDSGLLADHGSPLRIELWDTTSNSIVRSGPLSSLRLQIVPLNGDFGETLLWSDTEFTSNIVHERQGRRPLIVGDTTITLREGVAYISNLIFTDNSRCTRCRHFRLGARIHPHIIPLQESIKEAISCRFRVKDQRGKGYRKHYPPSLHDEVWRLEKISKDGKFHSRLRAEGIGTVKEFLCRHETNPASLRKILGSNVPDRTWNAIVRHAATCAVNVGEHDESYLFTDFRTCLRFDCICKLIAASFDGGQTFDPPNDLPAPQALLLQDVKREAYRRRNEWTRVSSASDALPEDLVALASSLLNAPAGPSTSAQLPGFLPSSSTSYHEVEVPLPVVYSPALSPLVAMFYAGEETWQGQQELETTLLLQPSTSMLGNAWTLDSETEAHMLSCLDNLDAHIPAYRKRRGGWCKIRAAIAFRSLRSSAVARRRGKSVHSASRSRSLRPWSAKLG